MTRYREIHPHDALADIVKCFWTLEATYTSGSVQDVHPDGCVELIFNFGSPYVSVKGSAPGPLPEATVVGFQNRTVRFRAGGTVKIVAARLYPWGALLFMRDNAATLTDSVRGLDAKWMSFSKRLKRRVLSGDYGQAVEDLQEYLLRQEVERTYYLHVIRAAAKLLYHTKGYCSITELADHCRLGMRQIQRGFKRVVGTSPKALARTVRFDRAMRALMTDGSVSLTSLAYECGYADQAHFSRDFTELCGQTPSQYVRSMRSLWKDLRDRDVVFMQVARSELQ